ITILYDNPFYAFEDSILFVSVEEAFTGTEVTVFSTGFRPVKDLKIRLGNEYIKIDTTYETLGRDGSILDVVSGNIRSGASSASAEGIRSGLTSSSQDSLKVVARRPDANLVFSAPEEILNQDVSTTGNLSSIDMINLFNASVYDIVLEDEERLFVYSTYDSDGYVLAESINNPFYRIEIERGDQFAFNDIDLDGDEDLFILSVNGFLKLYLNTGSSTVPIFEPTHLQTVEVPDFSGELKSFQVTKMADGNTLRCVILSTEGLSFYELTLSDNILILTSESELTSGFTLNTSAIADFEFADIDGDLDSDFIGIDSIGNLSIFRNEKAQFEEDLTFTIDGGKVFSQGSVITSLDVDVDGDLDIMISSKNGLELVNNVSMRIPAILVSVESNLADQVLKIGDTLSIAVNFDANVIVAGQPLLEISANEQSSASYSSGSGSNQLDFQYIIKEGDETDLLALRGSTSLKKPAFSDVIDESGSSTNLSISSLQESLFSDNNLSVDGIRPSVQISKESLYFNSFPVVFTLSFSEKVQLGDFLEHIEIENGKVDSLLKLTDQIYELKISQLNDLILGDTVKLNIMPDSFTDSVGNFNRENETDFLIFDREGPSIENIFFEVPEKATDTIAVTVFFDMDVQAFDVEKINISNGRVIDTATVISNSEHIFYISHSGGLVSFAIPPLSYFDLADNFGKNDTTVAIPDQIAPFFVRPYPELNNEFTTEISVNYDVNESSNLNWFLTNSTFETIDDIVNTQENILQSEDVEINSVGNERTIRVTLPENIGSYWLYGYLGDISGNQSDSLVLLHERILVKSKGEVNLDDQTIEIHPNPVTSYISITLREKVAGTFHAKIIDMTGRTVKESPFKITTDEPFTWDLHELESGTYSLRIAHEQYVTNFTFIKL
ncbi:MAG: T9SS type A sorting domain-containing protein, partial [Cyclobacteriaceae bacterium]